MAYEDARFGALYEKLLGGEVSFNASYSNIGARLYGAGNVAYIIGKNGDSFLLTSGSYDDFTGDHSLKGLKGGNIAEIGLYKNGAWKDFGDGIYDIEYDFEKAENHIITVPGYGMSVSQFESLLYRGYSSTRLIEELLKGDDAIGGYSQSAASIVDGYGGNDSILIDKGVQLARGGSGNDYFEGTPNAAAILDGGNDNDTFNGQSGSESAKQYLWIGGRGNNVYELPRDRTVVVIEEKRSGQQADIIKFASVLIGKRTNESGYIVVKTVNPDPNQLDIRFIEEPLLDDSGKEISSESYFSILYKGVEQAKVDILDWDLDGFLAQKEKYEDNIRSRIAVATIEQLVVPGNYSQSVLKQIENGFALTSISDKQRIDLTGQTLLDKSGYVSIADRFYLQEIKQNDATGQLELIFSQDVGKIGSTLILELDEAGEPTRRYASFSSPKIDGNKVVTSIYNTGDKGYIAILTSGWTNSEGISLEGQGNWGGAGVQSYTFTFGKDTIKPTIQSITKDGNNEIVVVFSENIVFTNESSGTVTGYLARKKQPTSLADLAHTFTVKDSIIDGNTLRLKIDKTLDGELYFLPQSIKDPTGNYFSTNWSNAQLLLFEDPQAAANRVKINREEDNSFIIPINVYWKNLYQQDRYSSDGSSITFRWKQDGSTQTSFSDSFYPFQDYGNYIYALSDNASPFVVTIDDFVGEEGS